MKLRDLFEGGTLNIFAMKLESYARYESTYFSDLLLITLLYVIHHFVRVKF